ncbi:MAG: GHKL domain-containing protein [Planctomycetes bacterium]|nr:GHKL domain-containing protein [Planctomycetota bacterium]
MGRKKFNIARLLLFCGGILGFIFIGYEVLERYWLIDLLEMTSIHRLHLIRGIGASLVAVAFIIIYLRRYSQFILPIPRAGEIVHFSDIPTENDRLKHHAKWFIRMRWIASGTALLLIAITVFLEVLPAETLIPLLCCAALLLFANVIYSRISRGVNNAYSFIMVQVIVDLVILAGFVEFSGGLENPIYFMYLLHVVLAGILLRQRDAFIITFFAFVLVCVVSFGQLVHIFPHHTIAIFPHAGDNHASYNLPFVLGNISVFFIMMFMTVYFVTLVVDRLRKSNDLLMQSIANALSEVEKRKEVEAQLVHSSKLSAIGRLAGQVTHEINNPVGIITARAKMLVNDAEKAGTNEKQLSDLRTILRHAERVSAIAKGLLFYSRPAVKTTEAVDINYLVKSVMTLIDQESIKEKRTLIRTFFCKEKLMASADFNDLQQALLNIVNNALEAIQKNGMVIIRVFKDKESTIGISVEDTGVGISEKNREKLFEPFFTTKPPGKGTGLGLAICYGIIRSYHGDINVESSEGKGSKFTILLPGNTAL